MAESKVIGAHLREPEKRTERAHLVVYTCKLEGECPLLKQGKCIHTGFLSICIHGGGYNKKSHTKQARSYRKELEEFKKALEGLPKMPQPTYQEGIHLIGEYYYLPYAHMSMCEQVAFVTHSHIFSSGKPFVLKSQFGPEQVVTLAKFRPHAFFVGEITSYQKEEIPIFLFHLKVRFPELYEQACAIDPDIAEMVLDTGGMKELKCRLSHLPEGTTKGFKVEGLANRWLDLVSYENDMLTVLGYYDQIFIFCGMKTQEGTRIEVMLFPDKEKTNILVTDPELISKILVAHPSLAKKE